MTTMKRGKKICNALRDVRRQIAAANDIPYETTDCHHEGECLGTCPKCEAEVRYIENQLSLRRAAGKAVSLVGLSLGISAAWASCANQQSATNQATATETAMVVDLTDDGDFETGEESEPNQIFTVVEVMPEFPGGEDSLMNFIKKNLKYPAPNYEINLQGRVTLSFTVEKDGAITNIEVMRSTNEELSQAAIRLVKMMPKWKPGTQLGKPVRTKYVMPFTFRLNDTPEVKSLFPKVPTP